MRPVTLDGTQHSAVFVCRVCGARDVGTTRGVVLAAAAAHYDVAHPDRVEAAAQLRVRAANLVAPTRRGGS
jgi:hypothetical protein